jgi:hypothetical protein
MHSASHLPGATASTNNTLQYNGVGGGRYWEWRLATQQRHALVRYGRGTRGTLIPVEEVYDMLTTGLTPYTSAGEWALQHKAIITEYYFLSLTRFLSKNPEYIPVVAKQLSPSDVRRAGLVALFRAARQEYLNNHPEGDEGNEGESDAGSRADGLHVNVSPLDEGVEIDPFVDSLWDNDANIPPVAYPATTCPSSRTLRGLKQYADTAHTLPKTPTVDGAFWVAADSHFYHPTALELQEFQSLTASKDQTPGQWAQELNSRWELCGRDLPKQTLVEKFLRGLAVIIPELESKVRSLLGQKPLEDRTINHAVEIAESQYEMEMQRISYDIQSNNQTSSNNPSLDNLVSQLQNMTSSNRTKVLRQLGVTTNNSSAKATRSSGSKWCDFHKSDTHNTSECNTLKKLAQADSGTSSHTAAVTHVNKPANSVNTNSNHNKAPMRSKVSCTTCGSHLHISKDCFIGHPELPATRGINYAGPRDEALRSIWERNCRAKNIPIPTKTTAALARTPSQPVTFNPATSNRNVAAAAIQQYCSTHDQDDIPQNATALASRMASSSASCNVTTRSSTHSSELASSSTSQASQLAQPSPVQPTATSSDDASAPSSAIVPVSTSAETSPAAMTDSNQNAASTKVSKTVTTKQPMVPSKTPISFQLTPDGMPWQGTYPLPTISGSTGVTNIPTTPFKLYIPLQSLFACPQGLIAAFAKMATFPSAVPFTEEGAQPALANILLGPSPATGEGPAASKVAISLSTQMHGKTSPDGSITLVLKPAHQPARGNPTAARTTMSNLHDPPICDHPSALSSTNAVPGTEQTHAPTAAEHSFSDHLSMEALSDYVSSKASLYTFPATRPSNGLSVKLASKSNASISAPNTMYDTGANIQIASKQWCDDNDIQYQTNTTPINLSNGKQERVVGCIPPGDLAITLKAGTPDELTVSPRIYVMEGVESIYDLLIGTPVMRSWGSVVDPVNATLSYRPFLLTHGDISTMTSIPMNVVQPRDTAAAVNHALQHATCVSPVILEHYFEEEDYPLVAFNTTLADGGDHCADSESVDVASLQHLLLGTNPTPRSSQHHTIPASYPRTRLRTRRESAHRSSVKNSPANVPSTKESTHQPVTPPVPEPAQYVSATTVFSGSCSVGFRAKRTALGATQKTNPTPKSIQAFYCTTVLVTLGVLLYTIAK